MPRHKEKGLLYFTSAKHNDSKVVNPQFFGVSLQVALIRFQLFVDVITNSLDCVERELEESKNFQ